MEQPVKRRSAYGSSMSDVLPSLKDKRPGWRRFDAKLGLTLHDAAIFYGDERSAEVVWTLEFYGYDDVMNVGEDGYPTPPAELVSRMRLDRTRRELQWQLLRKLRAGQLVATGYPAFAQLNMPPQAIAAPLWMHLEPDFAASTAEGAGQTVYGIRVFRPATPRDAASEPRAFSSARARRWYLTWIAEHGSRGTIPSREEDYAAAKQALGDGCSRKPIRDLRRELAPSAWTKQGRRKVG